MSTFTLSNEDYLVKLIHAHLLGGAVELEFPNCILDSLASYSFNFVMDLRRGDSILMFVPSLVSCVASSMTIVSYLSSITLRQKESAEIVFYISISNFLSSIGSIMGEPVDRSAACWFEAIVTNIFSLTSMTWNVVLTYMLFVIVSGKGFKLTWWIHLFSWSLPIIVTILPFMNATYGAPDGLGWCFIVPTKSTPSWGLLFWYWLSYYVWLWGSVGTIGFLLALTKWISRSHKESSQKILWKAIWKLQLYPLVIVFCWSVTAFTDTVLATPGISITSPVLDYLSLVLPCTQGTLTSLVYWYQFDEARHLLLHYFGFEVNLPSSSSHNSSAASHRNSLKKSSISNEKDESEDGRAFMKVTSKYSSRQSSKVGVDLIAEDVEA